MLCTEIFSYTQNNLTIFVRNLFSPCSAKRRASDKDLPVQSTRHAVTAAKKIGGEISCIVAGPKCAGKV